MTDAELKKNCNKKCKNCNGKGLVFYMFSQDETKYAACPDCFPNDRWGKQCKQWWDSGVNVLIY